MLNSTSTMRYHIIAAACASLAQASLQASLPGALGPLKFSKDGTFQISIFEDLHFGENAWDTWGPEQDRKSVTVLNKILDSESPDLVVLNGDLITGENGFQENATVYIDQITAPLIERGLSWASTYGNHDHSFNLSAEQLLARERRWPNARTTQMVFGRDAGVSNYYLPVYGSGMRWPWSAPRLILWFFDSRGGQYFQELDESGHDIPQPNWVDTSVVDWFRKTSSALTRRYGKTIPSLAFVHIPTNASLAAQTMVGIDENREPGINDDYALAQQAQGWCANGTNSNECAYGGQDGPFMRSLVETPGILGVFSGHDHGDTWCYKWDTQIPGMDIVGNGVNLCFGQHSGYGGYGHWIRGSRQVRISEGMLERGELKTWIRLESGDVVGSVGLNATYGEDLYPPTPNDKTYL
ncbi:metallophosphoesterase family protein [Aspergillus lucknowensis]|uniref:Metallo-dependent phosphatase-like protein n=1 Tax=Aspergillus lucknowensis TaxID=176173 RepID=A0ABR4M0Q4_9EURO